MALAALSALAAAAGAAGPGTDAARVEELARRGPSGGDLAKVPGANLQGVMTQAEAASAPRNAPGASARTPQSHLNAAPRTL
jgi:hypothetical protein